MRHFIILSFILPALGGLGAIVAPVRDTGSCAVESFSRSGERISDRGFKPVRDIKLLGRDTGRCF